MVKILKVHEHPKMRIADEPRQCHDMTPDKQPLVQNQPLPRHRGWRRKIARYHCLLSRVRTDTVQSQPQYQEQTADPARADNSHSTHIIPPLDITSPTASQRPRAGQAAGRKIWVVDGKMYSESMTGVPVWSVAQEVERDSKDNPEQSSFIGCEPLLPDLPREPRHDGGQQTPRQASSQRSQLLTPPSVHVPWPCRTVNRPSSNGFSHCYRSTVLPEPPSAASGQAHQGGLDGLAAKRRSARPHHLELHYDEQVVPPAPFRPASLPIAAVETHHSPLTALQPTSIHATLLDTQSPIIQHGDIQSAELEALDDEMNQFDPSVEISEQSHRLSVNPAAGIEAADSELHEEVRPPAIWYNYFVAARTWEYEDITDAYKELLQRAETTCGKSSKGDK